MAVKPKTTSQITERMYVRIISWSRETDIQIKHEQKQVNFDLYST